VEKGVKDAMKDLFKVPIIRAGTIPHPVIGRYGAAQVCLWPAAEGTGVIAGAAVKAVLTAAGIRNILTKVHGSTNPVNVLKATKDALLTLRTKDTVQELRGVELGDYAWPRGEKKTEKEAVAAS
jgi:small subunit ribosomal protein S5